MSSDQIYHELFINIDNKEAQKRLLIEAIELGLEFKIARDNPYPVLNYKNQEEIINSILEEIPDEGVDIGQVIKELKQNVIDGSLNFSSPYFFSFPDCGNSLSGVLGDLFSGMLNQNLISSYTSPTATFIEIVVINWLRKIAGFPVAKKPKSIHEVGGVSITGGVSANTIGLLLARENHFPGTMQTGLTYNPANICVFLPRGIGHYSIKAALGWLGLGEQSAVEVEITPDFCIDQNDLLDKITVARKHGNIPLLLVAYAGDSRTMSVDDFPSLAEIAKKNNMWFHVDACHGFSLLFSKQMRYLVQGIELADSVTIDPHKVLFIPYTSSFLLIKNPSKFSLISGISDLITREKYSFGQMTPFFGSRNFSSLKIWFLIKSIGCKGIGRLIDERHEKVKYFSKKIDHVKDVYRMNNVIINSCTFLYVPQNWKEVLRQYGSGNIMKCINDLNTAIHKRIIYEGKFHIHLFPIHDFKNIMKTGVNTVFHVHRIMIGNPLTTQKIIDEFIAYFCLVSVDEYRKLSL